MVLGHLGCDTILEGGANNSEQHTASIFVVNMNKVRLLWTIANYRGADKSLAQLERKQATVTEDFDVHISYL